MKPIVFVLASLFVVTVPALTGCGPISNVAGIPTPTSIPTATPNPTLTPKPTLTTNPTDTPFPTYTPFPTLTATPTSTATPPKKELLKEDFSGATTCFSTTSNAYADRFVRDGKFHLRAKTTNSLFYALCDSRAFSDFVFEVDATPGEGPDENGYGVVFRYSGNAFYVFQVSGEGTYALGYYDGPNSTWNRILARTVIPEVKPGKQTNHLKVIAVGNRIELYVNDISVGQVLDNRFASGQIGLTVSAFSVPNAYVTFDNIRIIEP